VLATAFAAAFVSNSADSYWVSGLRGCVDRPLVGDPEAVFASWLPVIVGRSSDGNISLNSLSAAGAAGEAGAPFAMSVFIADSS